MQVGSRILNDSNCLKSSNIDLDHWKSEINLATTQPESLGKLHY